VQVLSQTENVTVKIYTLLWEELYNAKIPPQASKFVLMYPSTESRISLYSTYNPYFKTIIDSITNFGGKFVFFFPTRDLHDISQVNEPHFVTQDILFPASKSELNSQ